VPFLVTALNPAPGVEALAWAGIAVWAAGTVGETVADRQLSAFRRDPANKAKVMDRGLWRTSRHPNYFFQIVTWVGFALIATAAPWGWLGWLSPILITLSILFVTGIPPTEAQALRSRGEAYRDYQRRTSPLVPWFPRRPA
jgi:steroid 5-alpha reductase family enzyme